MYQISIYCRAVTSWPHTPQFLELELEHPTFLNSASLSCHCSYQEEQFSCEDEELGSSICGLVRSDKS